LGSALLVPAARAQTPNATLESAATVPSSDAEQIDTYLRAAVQQIIQKKPTEASESSQKALALSQAAGNLAQQLRATNLLAIACVRSGQTVEAIRHFKEAAQLASQLNDKRGQALGLTRAGVFLRITGLYDEALACFVQAIALFRQAKDRTGETYALGSLSTVYSETGDFENARLQLQQAMPIAHELKDRVLDETLLVRLSIVEEECGHHELALQLGLQALALDNDENFRAAMLEMRRAFEQTMELQLATVAQTRLELFLHLGIVYSALGDYQKAAEFFERGLSVFDLRPLITAVLQGNLAGTQLRLGKATEARELALKAIANLRNSGGSKHWEATFLYYLAEANRLLGSNEEALVSYRQSIDAIEQARSLSIPTEVSRAGIVAARHEIFAAAIAFCVSQHREDEALTIAEAWHARAFLDILTESRIDLRKDLSSAQRDQEDKIFLHISAVQKELWSAGLLPAREQELKAELAATEGSLESFQLEVRRTNPLYARIKYPQPVKAAIVARELGEANTALIEYVLSEKSSFALIVYRGRTSVFTLPPQKEIEELVTGYRGGLSTRTSALTVNQSIKKLNEQSRQLYRKLLEPMAEVLRGARKLIIVPDGVLSYLPFETLLTDESETSIKPRYLLESFAIAYAPSASALFAIGHNKGAAFTRGLLAFGDPASAGAEMPGVNHSDGSPVRFSKLPYARQEVTDIGSLFSDPERRLFLGIAAREQTVKAELLDRYRYIHFAAHGVIDEEYPARSGILLAADGDAREDGVLRMNEVMRLKLNADLVTLSACSSGLGKLVNGEGFIGLTRSFLYAGADGVVVSLWDVNDLSTATLMKSFYVNLKRGLPRDEALRQAKLQMLDGPRGSWQHPYFWASFVLIGANN